MSVQHALEARGHTVEVFDPPRDALAIAQGVRNAFGGRGPEIVFNILHGFEVEDGVIQGVLELLGVPYTSSGVAASAMAMDKKITRTLVSAAGVRVPTGFTFPVSEGLRGRHLPRFPFILKPLHEGSTFGVSLVQDVEMFETCLKAWDYGSLALVEEFIRGRHLFVSLFGSVATGILEVVFENPIFDYEAKYTPGYAVHRSPTDLPSGVLEEAFSFAEIAQRELGGEGIGRTDFIYGSPTGDAPCVYFLEHNTQPGMTSVSLVPDIMKNAGWAYGDIIQWAVENPRTP
jgi:D-alanine-D-alanine ligase